jgi:hypothetical protein
VEREERAPTSAAMNSRRRMLASGRERAQQ